MFWFIYNAGQPWLGMFCHLPLAPPQGPAAQVPIGLSSVCNSAT